VPETLGMGRARNVDTGNNSLTGGNGNDTFVFKPGFGNNDQSLAHAVQRLKVAEIDANDPPRK
jgi:Ca2+-binding RTX toxin-like protein